MPLVRGRVIAETELSGRAKKTLDVLLWIRHPRREDLRALDELDILRVYLRSIRPFEAAIRLFVPTDHEDAIKALSSIDIEFTGVVLEKAGNDIREQFKGAAPELGDLVSTAKSHDIDCIATNESTWLPFIQEVGKLSMLLTDCSFLLPYSEIFVRGHDIPWAFRYKVWDEPWTAFYQLGEEDTFKPGLALLHKAYQKGAPADAQETGRSLVFNRLSNLCFTRDRLLWYEIQRLAAKRAAWKRQRFAFEIAYYLNFYYLLIYGAFDHAALFVSQLLGLGLPERQVGATYKGFLEALERKSTALHAIFTAKSHKDFIDRIAALRHFAAHRGSLMPTIVVEEPDHDPTVDELDADIRKAGLEEIINMLPEGNAREGFREMARTNARWARYQKETILEDVIPIELDNKFRFINPHLDTGWNFNRTMDFLNEVFLECAKLF
jgi:hypothetical protein